MVVTRPRLWRSAVGKAIGDEEDATRRSECTTVTHTDVPPKEETRPRWEGVL